MSCCEKIIEASQQVTPCECAVAGYCARHKCDKPNHFHQLCRTHVGYFEQYERGEGPGQHVGPTGPVRWTLGLGDVVAWLIRRATFGRVAMCASCQSRKARLNRIRLWPLKLPAAVVRPFVSVARFIRGVFRRRG